MAKQFKKLSIPRIIIENVTPQVNEGDFDIKKVVGDIVTVDADIFKDGHEVLHAFVKYREKGVKTWRKSSMRDLGNDHWQGQFKIEKMADYEFLVEATVDIFLSWKIDFEKKFTDTLDTVESEVKEAITILKNILKRATRSDQLVLRQWIARIEKAKPLQAAKILLQKNNSVIASKYPSLEYITEYKKMLSIKTHSLQARYSSWYEMFPRSQGTKMGKSATIKDCIKRIPYVKDLGFDVIYMPPIHPIGVTNRKGKNNSVKCLPDDPGCPYATGNKFGGHKAIEPQLGTIKDFEKFVIVANKNGIKIALDFALNCSPDHPYVKKHSDWFYKRPDGSIKYAENPPKKYEDVYPLNFYCRDWQALWDEILSIILFWANKGVRIFRVDNPHTKPVYFWKWLIDKSKAKFPDLIFLSEAFTKPKMMKMLAKVGFDQSYTYFTWRNEKKELEEYFTELTQTSMKDYFTGNLFTNTPDILPSCLQTGGRPAFKARFVLAATLSTVYGIYNSFELCENTAIPGREEYLNSEKYEYKVWDWDREGNIKDFIKKINAIRTNNSALQIYDNLKFYQADNNQILFYGKIDHEKRNAIFMIVNLDPHNIQQSFVYMPVDELGLRYKSYRVTDLITGDTFDWFDEKNFVLLDPHKEPVHLLRVIY